MLKISMKRLNVALAMFAGLAACPLAGAQSFPSSPVRLIVPFLAGGGGDTIARTIARGMEKNLGQSIIIENKAGAFNMIGAGEVARARPDGYTVGMVCLAPYLAELLGEKLPFDIRRQTVPLGMMAGVDTVILTRAGNSINSVEELMEQARKRPGALSVGMSQAATNSIPLDYMAKKANVQLTLVNYKGEPQALNDLLGGSIDFSIAGVGFARQHIQAGTVKAILMMGQERHYLLPNVPAVKDLKVDGFASYTMCFMIAPTAINADAADRLNRALNAAGRDPDVLARMRQEGFRLEIGGTPDQAQKLLAAERQRWDETRKVLDFARYREGN